MNDERCFVDSNIWLYAFIHRPDEDKRHEKAGNLIRHSSGITVSEQVIAEVSVNLLLPITPIQQKHRQTSADSVGDLVCNIRISSHHKRLMPFIR
jgi:predicted nucleic acid-binding protein